LKVSLKNDVIKELPNSIDTVTANPYPVEHRSCYWRFGKDTGILYSTNPYIWEAVRKDTGKAPSATYYSGRNVSAKQFLLTRKELEAFLSKHFVDIA
jgi:hypothetical protein